VILNVDGSIKSDGEAKKKQRKGLIGKVVICSLEIRGGV
jgi:hypothetical protein